MAALEKMSGDDIAAFKAQVDSLAPGAASAAPAAVASAVRRRRGPPTLESVSNAMLAAAMAMQRADVAPTAARWRPATARARS